MGTCASSPQYGHVCVAAGGHWWRTTFGKSDRGAGGEWLSSEACLMASTLVSWDWGLGFASCRDWKFIYKSVVNSRAALHRISAHNLDCLSRAVTEVPEPVHLGLVLLPRRRAGSPQTELLLSWKARHRSSPPQIRGGPKLCKSGIGRGTISLLTTPHPACRAKIESYLSQTEVNCPVPEARGNTRGSALYCTARFEGVSHHSPFTRRLTVPKQGSCWATDQLLEA